MKTITIPSPSTTGIITRNPKDLKVSHPSLEVTVIHYPLGALLQLEYADQAITLDRNEALQLLALLPGKIGEMPKL